MLNANITVNETLAQIIFTIGSRRYELTRFRSGRAEMYEEGSDGIFHWLGYHDDVAGYLPCHHARAFAEAAAALEARRSEFWAGYLSGADAWLAA